MFDVANWVACLNGENGPGGTPSHDALSVSPQGALEISSVVEQPPSLDRNHFSTPRVVAESHKRDERCRPGMPWFCDLVQLSTEIPLQLPVSRTLLKQSHNYVFHNPQHLILHAWCLGVDSSKNKDSLWRWQRELLPLRGHQQGPSTSQSGPYLRNGAEKIQWISPLPL